MNYLKNLLLILTFSLTSLFSFACHEVTLTETNAVDNGDGTFTYTFDLCFGTGAGSETYGFYLDFTGANLVSYPPSVTGPTSSNVASASVPPVSGNGDIEYGDWDDQTSSLLSGTANLDCISVTFTFDGPLTDVAFGGVQPAIGCAPVVINPTSCFGQLTLGGSATDASDGCSSDGSITANASNGFSPYTYSWSNGQTGSTISNLAPGTYSVTTTDAEGCTETMTFNVDSPSPADYILDITTQNCNGNNITWDIEDNTGALLASGSFDQSGTNITESVCSGCGAIFNITVPDNANCDGLMNLDVTDGSGNLLGSLSTSGSITLDCLTLPVESKESNVVFDALTNANRIFWSTVSENDNDYFSVLHSNDGVNWRLINKIPGAGSSVSLIKYETQHGEFTDGATNYYKITQIDYDGTSKEVNVLSVENGVSNELVKTINTMGQEVGDNYTGIVIRYFSDGSTEKTYSR